MLTAAGPRKPLASTAHVKPIGCQIHLTEFVQGKALGKQQQEVAAAVAVAAEARSLWLAKLAGMEQLLYSAQSAQFLDIRKREAEAFKVCTVQALTAEACC